MKIGTRIEIDYKGEIHKLLVTEETKQADIDSFYEGLKEPKKKPAKKSK